MIQSQIYIIMSQQNMRQSKPQNAAVVRVSGRITRGFSDLPKQQPKVESSQSEEEEEQSESAPKTKKIHHMTLKAMQRRKKLVEQMQRLGINPQLQKQVEKLPPKKRGRPKGSKKVADREEKQEYQIEEEDAALIEQEQVVSDKKEIILRKRGRAPKVVEPASDDIVEQSSVLKGVEVQIQMAANPPSVVAKTPEVPQQAPKKRGRKKKTQPQLQAVVEEQTVPAAKIYTVPKAQTYDNYIRFYERLMQQAREGQKQEIPLIFDRFSDPEAYNMFISGLRK